MTKTSNKNMKMPEVKESAILQMKKILADEKFGTFVRILVDSGGCSGFSYKFSIDNKICKENDITIIGSDDKTIFVTDKVSIKFIDDSSIDWVTSLTNSQFVVNNPMAKSSCGCGASFSL